MGCALFEFTLYESHYPGEVLCIRLAVYGSVWNRISVGVPRNSLLISIVFSPLELRCAG
jgi:hypothetical protein